MTRAFIARIEGVARARPAHTALIDGEVALSYAALIGAAAAVAARLRAAGLTAGDVVAVPLPRSAEWVTGVLACWMAGATPLPIDPSLPTTRQDSYAERSGARFAFRALRALVPSRTTASGATHLEPIPIDLTERAPLVPDDATHPAAAALAWIVFTSGSSGRAKGVRVPWDGVLPMLDDQIAAFAITPASQCAWILSPGFDASFSDIGTALLAGATLHVDRGLDAADPEALLTAIESRRITHIDLPPALLPHLDPDRCPASLETIIIGGEVADRAAVRRWAPRLRLVNVYGPTEATVCTSLHRCEAADPRPLIGAPIGGAVYLVEDEAGRPAKRGELLITGPGIARGYIDDPSLETARFVRRGHARAFKTGDRVRVDEDGAVVFEGRIDRQRKLRGQLVAPEEIEAALCGYPGVVRAAVTLAASPVAWVASEGPLDREALMAHLTRLLPAFMVPTQIVQRRSLPTGPSGKVDLRALQEEHDRGATERRVTLAEPVEPASATSPTARALLRIVAEALHCPPPAATVSFRDLGGTSLSTLAVVARAEALGMPLSAERLLSAPSLAALAEELESSEAPTVGALEARSRQLLSSLPERAPADASVASPAASEDPPRVVLLTGATGALGARVAAALTERAEMSGASGPRVICLARDGAAPAHERVRAALRALGAPTDRLEVLAGDLTRPRLGLEPSRYDALAGEVDHVIHLAARVSVTESLETLFPANVEGTLRVLRFALRAKPKRLSYASTLSVFVGTDDREGRFTEDALPEEHARVYGGYAQSKVLAELLLRGAAAQLPSLQLLRYGLLTGDVREGQCAPGAWLGRTIRGLATLAAYPTDADRDLAFDVTPIDHAARVTAALTRAPVSGLTTFHIAADEPASFSDLLSAIAREGVALSAVSRSAFLERVGETLGGRTVRAGTDRDPGTDSDVGAACLALGRALGGDLAGRHRGLDLFEATRARFDTTRTRALLGPRAACPKASPDLLGRYVRAALAERAP